MNITNLEKQRIDDFYKVLTFHIVAKIQHYFKGDIKKFYSVTSVYRKFILCKDKNRKYCTSSIHEIYDSLIKFNQCGLDSNAVRHILGKDDNGKYLKRSILDYDDRIVKINNGSLCIQNNVRNAEGHIIGRELKRFHYTNKYMIHDIQYLEDIFESPELLKRVMDASSDFYNDRQRRLIFTQILKLKKYHYKTSTELIDNSFDTDEFIIDDTFDFMKEAQ